MSNTDSFGQSKPTFIEDPLADGQPLRDDPGTDLGQTGHLKGLFESSKQEVLAGAGIAGTIDLEGLADSVISVKAYVTSSGAPAAPALLAEGVDYSVSIVSFDDPQKVELGDQQALATPAGGQDSFGQSKPTFVDSQPTGEALATNFKHQNFNQRTRLTMLTDQSLNTLVVSYNDTTQKSHTQLP